MAYHEAFWSTTATVAAAILVATAVALGQSIDTVVERVREHRRRHETVGSPEWNRTRRKRLAMSWAYGIASIALTTLALLFAMICLLRDSDVLPPWAGLVPLLAGIVAIFLQVFASADAKIAEVRALPKDDAADLG